MRATAKPDDFSINLGRSSPDTVVITEVQTNWQAIPKYWQTLRNRCANESMKCERRKPVIRYVHRYAQYAINFILYFYVSYPVFMAA